MIKRMQMEVHMLPASCAAIIFLGMAVLERDHC